MVGITMNMIGNNRPLVIAPKVWTGITAGLQFNLLNAPSSGTSWVDASGNSRNATLQGSASYVSTNSGGVKLNNANYGGTDYISVPYNISSSTATIEIVGSFSPTSYWATIWGNEIYNSASGYLAYMTSQTSVTWGKGTGGVLGTVTATNNVRHWVFVINGTSFSLYINGSQVGTTATLSPAQSSFVNSEFYFGARHANNGVGPTDKMNNSNASLQPVFYQMRVYNTALSGANVSTNYAAVKSSVSGGYGLP